jgi:hypothetical protein
MTNYTLINGKYLYLKRKDVIDIVIKTREWARDHGYPKNGADYAHLKGLLAQTGETGDEYKRAKTLYWYLSYKGRNTWDYWREKRADDYAYDDYMLPGIIV